MLSLVFSDIYILQGSVKTCSCCGGIYNNHTNEKFANCPQSV